MMDTDEILARIAALEEAVALLIASQHAINPDPSAAPQRFGNFAEGLIAPDAASDRDDRVRAAMLRLQRRVSEVQEALPTRLVDG
jgi:hypothetical protein